MLLKSQTKLIRSLQQKKYRKQLNLFVVEGVKLVNELLLSEFKIHSLFGTNDDSTKYIAEHNFPVKYKDSIIYITEKEMKSVSALTTPNKFLAIVEIPESNEIIPGCDLYIALDGIRDPGNMGTIIRNADWFGIKQVICSPDCADIYNPKVVQSTMGSIFRVHVKYTDLSEYFKNCKENIYTCELNGTDIHQVNFSFPSVIIIGNESEGLRFNMDKISYNKITIPAYGSAESLNAAVACGIILNVIRNKILR